MSASEQTPFEQPFSSLDRDLSAALVELDKEIQGHIRAKIGNKEFEAYQKSKKLEHEVDSAFDASLVVELYRRSSSGLRAGARSIADLATEYARKLIDEDSVFDGMENDKLYKAEMERKDMARAVHDERMRSAVRRLGTLHEDEYVEAFSDVTFELMGSIKELLADPFPELEVFSIDNAQIIFHRYDKTDTVQDLEISLAAKGRDITTRAAYVHYPPDGGAPKREPIEIAAFNGTVEGISIDRLKRDVLRVLRMRHLGLD